MRKRNAWSYIDARDLGEIVRLCLEKDGLGFQVFNATNDTITLNMPTREGAGEALPEYAGHPQDGRVRGAAVEPQGARGAGLQGGARLAPIRGQLSGKSARAYDMRDRAFRLANRGDYAGKQRGPRRSWRIGALFRCSRNFWDVADDISAEKALGLRARRRDVWSVIFWSALPLWHVERLLRFDPGHARVIPFGPAESWLPRLSAAPRDRPAVVSPSLA